MCKKIKKYKREKCETPNSHNESTRKCVAARGENLDQILGVEGFRIPY